MLELNNLHLPVDYTDETLKKLCAAKMRVKPGEILKIRFIKKSVDARRKDNVFYNASVAVEITANEEAVIKKCDSAKKYIAPSFPKLKKVASKAPLSPVVCGAGPAGLFAAYVLSLAGLKPVLLERGADCDTRKKEVEAFFSTGRLNAKTNVQFGEGGAGTFSDGKLTTNIHDDRCARVLRTFYECGAPEEILYLAKPHLGTDKLCDIVKNLRKRIIDAGGEVRFFSRLTDFTESNGKIVSVKVKNEINGEEYSVICNELVIACGHSARDVFEMLKRHGAEMEQKPFSIGVRIEHSQRKINEAQYGKFAKYLPAADYKLACHLENGRSVYTFCMCPGGSVVASASENGRLVVNGMSEFARDGENANSALLVNAEPSDFGSDDVLAGVEFQRKYEEAAFALGGGGFNAPAQRLGDFIKGVPSKNGGSIVPTYRPGVKWCDISGCLPKFASEAIREAIPVFARRIKGFDDKDAVLTGVETRSSSPVRIKRNERLVSSIDGIFPCGEGAGYAGGIMSAAVDGIRVAEQIIENALNEQQ